MSCFVKDQAYQNPAWIGSEKDIEVNFCVWWICFKAMYHVPIKTVPFSLTNWWADG